jgi:CRP/FNR family transcriptional regulator, cyclic AMP receptor protein
LTSILIIEDNTEILENLSEFLEMENYRVLIANNGSAGIEMATRFIPQLIICDVRMPIMDGYEVLHHLLDMVKTKHIPFIFSTAMSDTYYIKKGLELGADDYIVKPYELDNLLQRIRTWIDSGTKRCS